MFSGSFLENLKWPFFQKVMVAEKNNFFFNFSSVQFPSVFHSVAKGKVISKCKNDKP